LCILKLPLIQIRGIAPEMVIFPKPPKAHPPLRKSDTIADRSWRQHSRPPRCPHRCRAVAERRRAAAEAVRRLAQPSYPHIP